MRILSGALIRAIGLFFPFHRYFVWSYTQALKNDCGYTGVAPYWDWTLGTFPYSDLLSQQLTISRFSKRPGRNNLVR
jgi:hypothetical protein